MSMSLCPRQTGLLTVCSCILILQLVCLPPLAALSLCALTCRNTEWTSGDRLAVAEWEYGLASNASANIAYHKIYRQTQLLWSETQDQTDYGNWYWATDSVANLTHQSGSDVDVRGAFTSTGVLANTNDTNYRAINNNYPTFGFAKDLGAVSSTAVSTLFTLGLAQEQAIQFDNAQGNVSVPSLWTSYYATETDAVSSARACCLRHCSSYLI